MDYLPNSIHFIYFFIRSIRRTCKRARSFALHRTQASLDESLSRQFPVSWPVRPPPTRPPLAALAWLPRFLGPGPPHRPPASFPVPTPPEHCPSSGPWHVPALPDTLPAPCLAGPSHHAGLPPTSPPTRTVSGGATPPLLRVSVPITSLTALSLSDITPVSPFTRTQAPVNCIHGCVLSSYLAQSCTQSALGGFTE